MRMGLNIKSKSGSDLEKLIIKEEPNLAKDFKPILLKPAVPEKGATFKDGSYGSYKIRYINLDPENSISIDYAFQGDIWAIGTSKNTIRAILDK